MSSYRFVMRAYPADYRAEVGDELVDTANEMSTRYWSLRQSFGLLVGGVRTSGRLATQGDAKRCWAQGLASGLIIMWMSQGLFSLLLLGLDLPHGAVRLTNEAVTLGMGLAMLCAASLLTVSTRTGAVVVSGLLASAPMLVLPFAASTFHHGVLVPVPLLIGACWFISRFGTGGRALSPPVVAMMAAAVAGLAFSVGNPLVPLGLPLVVAIGGLLAIRIDPRWTVAGLVVAIVTISPLIALAVAIGLGLVVQRSITRLQQI